MPLPLEGRTAALAEGRQLADLAQMLEKEGATTLRCPLLSIMDAPDPAPVLAWLRELAAGRFHYLILMTGEGLRRLLGAAERAGFRAEVVAALATVYTVTRGPKPVRALKEIGLAPSRVADEPTTAGVIAALGTEPIQGRTVGVQHYSESNPPLMSFLASAGATARAVLPYVYAPAADADRVADLIERMARGEVDVMVFTSSPQVDRLYEVARDHGLEGRLKEGLDRTSVAAVGPIVTETLHRHGARADICPAQGFVMKNLVQQIKARLTAPR